MNAKHCSSHDFLACWIIKGHLNINQTFYSFIAVFQSIKNGIRVAIDMAHACSDYYLHKIFEMEIFNLTYTFFFYLKQIDQMLEVKTHLHFRGHYFSFKWQMGANLP